MRRSKPTRRPVRTSTTRWFSKKNASIGTRVLFVPVLLSLVFGLATSLSAHQRLPNLRSSVIGGMTHLASKLGWGIHADVDLALVNVSVTDTHDRPSHLWEAIASQRCDRPVVGVSDRDVDERQIYICMDTQPNLLARCVMPPITEDRRLGRR